MYAQIHRFHDKVALFAREGDSGERTVYLTPSQATAIGISLLKAAADCENVECFTNSSFATRVVTDEKEA